MAVPFATLKLARRLEAAGFSAKQSGDMAEAIADATTNNLVTKDDLAIAISRSQNLDGISRGGRSQSSFCCTLWRIAPVAAASMRESNSMTGDEFKYRVFYRVWKFWHSDLQRFKPFMRYVPEKYFGTIDGRRLVNPARYEVIHCENRPWWHLCCNGNEGGWRTRLCTWLECKWRDTDYYRGPPDWPTNDEEDV